MADKRKRKKSSKKGRRKNGSSDGSGLGSGDVMKAMDEMIPAHTKDYMRQKHM